MSLSLWLRDLMTHPTTHPRRRRRKRKTDRALRPLLHDLLENRLCPSGYLLITNYDTNSVLRFDEVTGAPAPSPGNTDATFVSKNSGTLYEPMGLVFGPQDHKLYVASGFFGGKAGNGHPNAVLRYDGSTGAFVDNFTQDSNLNLTSTRGIVFGPDGNLYISDGTGTSDGTVVVYNGKTGAFIDDLFPRGTDGLSHPQGLVFGPDGRGDGKLDLYISSAHTNSVLRYDFTSGLVDTFVSSGSGGLDHPIGLTFGPDGNLYVASLGVASGLPSVMRFDGSTGAPMPSAGNGGAVFVASGFGGLLSITGLVFGPDGKNDGGQDLYVPTVDGQSVNRGKASTSTVLRYDLTGAPAPSPGNTGATFITAGSGGLDNPTYLIFTETDPTTLAYTGTRSAQLNAAPTATVADAVAISNLVSASLPLAPVTVPDGSGDGWLPEPALLPGQRARHSNNA
jgi:glucose/arabinose dehydrogenase